MAFALVFDFPDGTREQYEAVLRELGVEPGASATEPGRLFHAAGPGEEGWRVIDVWESRDALDAFFRERLADALERARMSSPLPPQVFEIQYLALSPERPRLPES